MAPVAGDEPTEEEEMLQIPHTNKVYINGNEEELKLDVCQKLPNGDRTVKVCGTNVRITPYLRNDCAEYKSFSVGTCDSSQDAETCQEVPLTDGQAFYQSYKIEQC